MANSVSVAVIGAGHMGKNHARCLASMKDVHLVAVVDSDEESRHSVATAFECSAVASIDKLPQIDAAVVAVPSALHDSIGCALMERGIHCLIEKPLALDAEGARRLIDTSNQTNKILQVGHVERFNPAVRQLQELLDGEQILVANARRMSAFSSRVHDIDVVMDLMVHDLDVMLFLMGEDVEEVVARGIDGPHGSDHVTALVGFQGGRMASLTASRITQNQIRRLEVTTEDRFFTVDYANQELLIFRQGRIGGVGDQKFDGRYVLDVETRRVFVRRAEPLVAELEHFIRAVRGEHPVEVDGQRALAALELVWSIQGNLAESGQE